MADAVRLCVIGAGAHARRNIYPSLFRLTGTQVTANCDLKEQQARETARRHAIPNSYADYHRMIQAEKPDGAIICIGPEAHAAMAIELMEHGLHVYTEKPNAPSLERSMAVLQTQQRTGRVCMVGYKKRFAPAYRKARQLIDDPQFGRPLAMSVVRSCGGGEVGAADMRTHLLDWSCHTLDVATYLLGPVRHVRTEACPGERYAYAVSLGHHNGAAGVQVFTNGPAVPEESVYIAGAGGVTINVGNSVEMQASRRGQPFTAHQPSFTVGCCFSDVEQGFAGELQEFVDAIAERREPESSIARATHTLAVFEAMWTSAQTGRVEEVEYQP